MFTEVLDTECIRLKGCFAEWPLSVVEEVLTRFHKVKLMLQHVKKKKYLSRTEISPFLS